jgi:replicative DNA helicase
MGAAQLNREIEHRVGAEPQLSDLRDSGSIEQDASQVWFIRSPWVNPSDQDIRQFSENIDVEGNTLGVLKAIPVHFYIKKNRNGPTGKSEIVKFVRSTNDFQTLARPR